MKKERVIELVSAAVDNIGFIVQRNSNNIKGKDGKPVPLPFCIMGLDDISNNYSILMKQGLNTLNELVDVPVTLEVSRMVGNLLFTYKQGKNIDVIFITLAGKLFNYTDALDGIKPFTKSWKTAYLEYAISNEDFGAAQKDIATIDFRKVVKNSGSSVLRMHGSELPEFNGYKMEVILLGEVEVNSQIGLVGAIIPVPEGLESFEIKYDIFQSWKGMPEIPEERLPPHIEKPFADLPESPKGDTSMMEIVIEGKITIKLNGF